MELPVVSLDGKKAGSVQLSDEIFGLVQRGDRKLIVAASDLTTAPTAKARVVISSVVYEIISVQSLWSGDQAAAYVIQIRGPA